MNIAHDPILRNMSSLMDAGALALPDLNDEVAMDTDIRELRTLAQTYFDAAYAMDAEKFAAIFHPSSSVTKVADDGEVGVTPIATWLAVVRNAKAPKQNGSAREDEIVSIDVESELALLKLKLQVPPRHFTDLLSCLKVNGSWKIVQKVMTSKTDGGGDTSSDLSTHSRA